MAKKAESTLLFLTLLFLPTQLGKHFWPNFSFIYSIRIDYFSPTIYFWDLLVLFLICLWIIRGPKVNQLALNLFLFFLMTQIISIFTFLNMGASLVRLQQYAIVGLFGVYIASQNFDFLKGKFFWGLSLSILGESLLGLAQIIKGSTIGFWILGERTFTISTPAIAKFDILGRQFLRPYGTFPHPNVLAGFSLIGLCLINMLKDSRRFIHLINIFGFLIIVLSVSRTALIAGVSAATFILNKRLLLGLILVLLLLSPLIYIRFESLIEFDHLSFLRRQQLQDFAWEGFLQSPIIGLGLNNFISYQAKDLVVGPSRFLQPVHNIFFLSLVETGLIGFLGFLTFLILPIIRLLKKPSSKRINAMLLIWMLIAFLGLFDHYFLTLPQGYRLLFLIWGLSFTIDE